MSAVAICGVAHDKVYKTEREERWCFAEPVWTYKCDGCGRDAHEFGSGW